jgi:hypothetical protein
MLGRQPSAAGRATAASKSAGHEIWPRRASLLQAFGASSGTGGFLALSRHGPLGAELASLPQQQGALRPNLPELMYAHSRDLCELRSCLHILAVPKETVLFTRLQDGQEAPGWGLGATHLRLLRHCLRHRRWAHCSGWRGLLHGRLSSGGQSHSDPYMCGLQSGVLVPTPWNLLLFKDLRWDLEADESGASMPSLRGVL